MAPVFLHAGKIPPSRSWLIRFVASVSMVLATVKDRPAPKSDGQYPLAVRARQLPLEMVDCRYGRGIDTVENGKVVADVVAQ